MSLFDRLQSSKNEKINAEKEAGKKFLEENKNKEGVQELQEGIQYQIVQQGNGGANPTVQSKIKAHYAGRLLNGKEFDSSYKRGQPFTANINQLISGWQKVLPLMSEGDKYKIWLSSDNAYGDNGAGGSIPGGALLEFDIELIEIIK